MQSWLVFYKKLVAKEKLRPSKLNYRRAPLLFNQKFSATNDVDYSQALMHLQD